MKKKFLIILVMLFLTGCSANYNLNIKDDNFYESITISALNSNEEEINSLNNGNESISSTKYNDLMYSKNITKLSTKTKYNFSHVFSYEDFQTSLSNKCFKDGRLDFTDGYYTLFLKDFNCYGNQDSFADNYKISIKTDYKVLNTNADYNKNNTYHWTFNKNNYKNKSIIFQYSKLEIKENQIGKIKPILISLGVSILIGIIMYIFTKYLNHKKVM